MMNVRNERRPLAAAFSVAVIVLCGLALAGCGGSPTQVSGKVHKNKFSPKKYGVKGSPLVVGKGKRVPRGGGRYMVGRPYKIAGKWYYPKKVRRYNKVGIASWYGPTFHGRRTANGEIFDMHALSAAHPTLPLPSYARVTNLRNGRSVIVRINDRGPFHGRRMIDLSKRAAETLDFGRAGTQKVRVKYLGRARLDGQDVAYLAASYKGPGKVHVPATMVADSRPAETLNRPYNASRSHTQVAYERTTTNRLERNVPFLVAKAPPRKPARKREPIQPLSTEVERIDSPAEPVITVAAVAPTETEAATGGPLVLLDFDKLPEKETSIFKRKLLPFNTSSYAPQRRISAAHAAILEVTAREQAWRQMFELPVVHGER